MNIVIADMQGKSANLMESFMVFSASSSSNIFVSRTIRPIPHSFDFSIQIAERCAFL